MNHQNNYVEKLNVTTNVANSFDILVANIIIR